MKHLTELRIDALQRLREDLSLRIKDTAKLLYIGKLNVAEAILLLSQFNNQIKQIDEIFIETDYSESLKDSML